MSIDYTSIATFAQAHRNDDPQRLLLQRHRYPSIDMRWVAQQLEGMRQAPAKWPALAGNAQYVYPPRINREQSSSEATARYKALLVGQFGGGRVADLTGGMGIDSLMLSMVCESIDYCEQDELLAELCKYNFSTLATEGCIPLCFRPNIRCHVGDSLSWIATNNKQYDTLLIDPSRRDAHGHKTVAFEDSTPDLSRNLPLLLGHCRQLLVKASPMIDIVQASEQISAAGGCVREVHILAVNGECKEVDFVVTNPINATEGYTIHCVCLTPTGQELAHSHFTPEQEAAAIPTYATSMGHYLYEPDATLMKGGCYNLIGQRYALSQLSHNTHLYTSDNISCGFPGRCFEVLQELVPRGKAVARLIPGGKAHVAVRNYPCTAEELRHRLHLSEGGNLFVIGATIGKRATTWLCNRIDG